MGALHSGRMILELAGPGGSMASSRVVEHLPRSMGASSGTLCDPSNTAVEKQVCRWEICGLLTWAVQTVEVYVRMLRVPVLSPHSLRTDLLLYPISHPTKVSRDQSVSLWVSDHWWFIWGSPAKCFQCLAGFHQSISSSFPLSVSLLLSIRC